ncbi:MAG: hypothetical protein WBV94_29565 [Blastocatellia bacterium]
MQYRRLLVIISIICISGNIFAQSPKPSFNAKVQVVISGDEVYEQQLISYMNRNLRSIGDVEITDDDPSYRVRVAFVKSACGVIAASVVFTTVPYWAFNIVRNGKLDDIEKLILNRVSDSEQLGPILVMTDSDIERLAKRIVAEFDASVLEGIRKNWAASQKGRNP